MKKSTSDHGIGVRTTRPRRASGQELRATNEFYKTSMCSRELGRRKGRTSIDHRAEKQKVYMGSSRFLEDTRRFKTLVFHGISQRECHIFDMGMVEKGCMWANHAS